MSDAVPGRLCLVLHTHLPWVPHFGDWPVGEEWLHQAFTRSWWPVVRAVERVAATGRTGLLTLGVTPVVAAMLDDPYTLDRLHTWTATWRWRAVELARRGGALGEVGRHEYAAATACLADLEARWLRGGSAVLARLGPAVELLGGPATHPVLPLLDERYAAGVLTDGLDDAWLRFGRRPRGIWLPECAYRPGLEHLLHGVEHLVLESDAIGHDTALGRPLDAGVVAFARDLAVTDRVWDARTGYPTDPAYRDFHAFDHTTGIRPFRVTGLDVPEHAKDLWSAPAAAERVRAHAADFLTAVRARLLDVHARTGRPGLAVAAWDTELFGHWWHEGPAWLEEVLRRAADHGVTLSTLGRARADGYVGPPVEVGETSWGRGKDFRLWDGPAVEDLRAANDHAVARLLGLARRFGGTARNPALDQLARETHLLTASDWAFMVTRDSAAAYARDRARAHAAAVGRLADLLETHGPTSPEATAYAAERREVAGPFGHVDARRYSA